MGFQAFGATLIASQAVEPPGMADLRRTYYPGPVRRSEPDTFFSPLKRNAARPRAFSCIRALPKDVQSPRSRAERRIRG